jgi:hypothetical protein
VSQKHLDAAIQAFGCTAQQNLPNHLWSLLSIKLNNYLFFKNQIYYYYFLVVKCLIYLPVLSVHVMIVLEIVRGSQMGWANILQSTNKFFIKDL